MGNSNRLEPRRSVPGTPLGTAVCLLFLAFVGCSGHPAFVCMKGDITAKGAIKTTLTTDNSAQPLQSRPLPRGPKCAPKVAVIDIDGLLVNRNLTGSQSFGENPVALFREKLEAAATDPGVAAVVLRINSPGGGVAATDMMRRDLIAFQQRTGLPVIACLMDVGAGGAYYIATAADTIVAHPTTITGGLGVILNLYEMQEALSQQNIFERTVKSGELVDMGSPIREIEKDELEVLQEIAKEQHRRLRSAVTESRPGLVQRLPEEVPAPAPEGSGPKLGSAGTATKKKPASSRKPKEFEGTVFDGRVFTSSQAQKLGLIDSIGYLDDAIGQAEQRAGITASRIVLYRRSNDRALTPYDITPNTPGGGLLPVSIPGFDRALLPTYLYLWQPEPLYEKTSGP